ISGGIDCALFEDGGDGMDGAACVPCATATPLATADTTTRFNNNLRITDRRIRDPRAGESRASTQAHINDRRSLLLVPLIVTLSLLLVPLIVTLPWPCTSMRTADVADINVSNAGAQSQQRASAIERALCIPFFRPILTSV